MFEDQLSEVTMLKMLSVFGDKYHIGTSYNARGFGYIRNNIKGFNEASVATSFFILTDLDKYECPSLLKREWLSKPQHPNLIFRVAVREVESWLLADREGFADYTGISIVNVPIIPDLETDPKRTLINLVRKSRKRSIKTDIIPLNDKAKIGPDYNGRLTEYVQDYWDINRARLSSRSLDRAINQLQLFDYQMPR